MTLTRLTAKQKLHDWTTFLLLAFMAKKNYTKYNIQLVESPGLGVAVQLGAQIMQTADGGGLAPAPEGTAVHRWSQARLDTLLGHVHI